MVLNEFPNIRMVSSELLWCWLHATDRQSKHDRADDGELIKGNTDVPMDKLDGAEMMGDDAADEDSIANYRHEEHSGHPCHD